MRVNVDGVFLGMKSAIAAMQPGGASGRGGCIINISSVSAGTPFPDHAAYGTSKAAVSAMTRHVAKECVATGNGIRVNAIAPGVVRTPMLVQTPENLETVNALQPLGILDPEEVAATALYLASDEARRVTGAEILIDGAIGL